MSQVRSSPVGWVEATLSDLGNLLSGQSPPSGTVNQAGIGTPYVTGPDQWDGLTVRLDKWTTDPRRVVPDGCIFVTVKGAGVGTLFPGVPCAIGRDIYAFKPHHQIPSPFIRLALEHTIDDVKRNAVGDIPGLSRSHILDHVIGVPPLNEQRRIVAKLEALQERTRNAREALEAIPLLIEKFRQSILAAAFRGDLTADWRAKNPDVEPGSVLLDRIRTERSRKWEEAELAKLKARGKTPTDDRWKSKYEAPALVEATGLPELPEGWCWANLGSLIVGIESGSSFKCDERPPSADEIGVLKVSAVTWGEYQEKESKTCTDATKMDSSLFVKKGDFLFSRANTIELVGACVIAEDVSQPVMLSDKILRFLGILCPPEWLMYALRSPWGRTSIETLSTGNQLSMRNISQESIRRIRVPIAPLEEMRAVIRLDQIANGAAAVVEGELQAATTKIEQLESSILAKAFRGELVPQDPNDEPASVLLERIRAEREQQQPQASRGHRTRRSTTDSPADVDNEDSDDQDDIDSETEPASSPAGASRKPRAEAAEHQSAEPEERPRASIDNYTLEDILAAFRPAMPTSSRYHRDNVIRAVARHLGFDRAGSRIREAIEDALPTAARRHIAWYSGTEVWIATRTITDYTRDELKEYFLAAIGTTWHDRQEAIRLATRYLGFTRTGPTIEDTWKSIINGLHRDGRIERDSSLIRRAPSYS